MRKPILSAILLIVCIGAFGYFAVTKNQKAVQESLETSSSEVPGVDDSSVEPLDSFLDGWEEIQRSVPFRPTYHNQEMNERGVWGPPTVVQFLSEDALLVSFEDSNNVHLAVFESEDDNFLFKELYKNQAALPYLTWEGLIYKYNGVPSRVPTYVKSWVYNGEIRSFSEFTEVSETRLFAPGELTVEEVMDGKAKVIDEANLFSVDIPGEFLINKDNGFAELSSFDAQTVDYKTHIDESWDGPCGATYYDSGAKVYFKVNLGPDDHGGEGGGTNVGVQSTKEIVIDGVRGVYHVVQPFCTFEGQVLDVHLEHEHRFYTFSFEYNPKNYSDAEKVFDEILSSIEFLN